MKTKYLKPEFDLIEVDSNNQLLAGSDVPSGQYTNIPGTGTNPVHSTEEDEGDGTKAPGYIGGIPEEY